MTPGAQPPKQGYRTLRCPLAEAAYDRLLTDRCSANDRLEALDGAWAALCPEAVPWGSAFCGFPAPSLTPQLLGRRMRLAPGRPVFPCAPAWGMPSMTGRPHDVAHAVVWRRLHGPCGAMAHVLGHNALSW